MSTNTVSYGADALASTPPGPRRDYKLLALSLLLTAASLKTTLNGSQLLLGETPWALSLAIGVQAVPVLLVTGLAGQNMSRLVRIAVALLCMSLSIYASTASFQEQLGSAESQFQDRQVAIEQHSRLVAALLPALDQEAKQAAVSVEKMRDRLTAEKTIGLQGKRPGIGPAYRRQTEQLFDLEAQAKLAQKLFDSMKGKLSFSTEDKSPEQILALDREAWQSAPVNLRAAAAEPSRARYLRVSAQRAKLARPLYELMDGSAQAWQAFVAASALDLIALLIGLGVSVPLKSTRRGLVRSIGFAIAECIRAAQHSVHAIWKAMARPHDPLHTPPVESAGVLTETFMNIRTRLVQGNDKDAMATFLWTVIAQVSKSVEYSASMPSQLLVNTLRQAKTKSPGDEQYTESTGYIEAHQILFAALCDPRLAWAEPANEGWFIRGENVAMLLQYLHSELAHEQSLGAAHNSKPTPGEKRLLRRALGWIAELFDPPDPPVRSG